MPGTGKYGTVASRLRKKNTLLEKCFPFDPQHDGSLTHEKLIALSNQYLIPPVQAGDPLIAPRVSLDYSASPDILRSSNTSAVSPHKGLPMTAYSPNVVSPGADPGAIGDTVAINNDPLKASDPGLTPADVRPSAVLGINGTVDPSTAGPEIGALRLDATRETLQPGLHNIK